MLNGNGITLKLLAKRVTPLVLLLTVHSVVVSGFHHHANQQTPTVEQGTSVEADDTDQGRSSPVGGGDSSCVSCQLQRTFASEVRTPSVVELVLTEPVKEPLPAPSPTNGRPTLVLSDRAPPIAHISSAA